MPCRQSALTLLIAALLLAGCSNPDRPTQSAILNPPTNSAPLELVRTITEPGNGGVFGSVGSVAVDDDGNLYIGDYQQQTVFALTRDGEYIRTIGSPGEGPGEFQIPVAIHALGDALHVFDNRLYRVSVFDRSDGAFMRSQSVKVDEWTPMNVLGYSDDAIVMLTSSMGGGSAEPQWNYSIRRMDWSDAASAATSSAIWEVPGPETFALEINGMSMMRVKPLAQHPSCAFAGGFGYCAHSSIAIEVFDAAGDTVQVVRIETPPAVVTPAERESALERFTEPLRSLMQVSDYHPAFSGPLVVESGQQAPGAGRIWLRRSASTDDGTLYWVIDRTAGTIEARTIDGAVTLHAVHNAQAIGVARDAEGKQAVVVYQL